MKHPKDTALILAARLEGAMAHVEGVRGVYLRARYEVVVALDGGALDERALAERTAEVDDFAHDLGVSVDFDYVDADAQCRKRGDYPVIEHGYCIEVTGDACQPARVDRDLPPFFVDVIAHACNDVGAWGRGFVLALDERFPQVKWKFLADSRSRRFGEFVVCEVGHRLYVANIVAQRGLPSRQNPRPFSQPTFMKGLRDVRDHFREQSLEPVFHMPRVGSGYGGVPWESTHAALEAATRTRGLRICVYTPNRKEPT